MTAPLPTPAEVEEMRERHAPYEAHGITDCDECGTAWPCDAARLLALVVSAETGVDLIAAERRRQIDVEGYTPEHDAHHYDPDVLARAGAAYALPDWQRGDILGRLWPWGVPAWKPTPNDRVRELAKAGALIAAAIDAELSRG